MNFRDQLSNEHRATIAMKLPCINIVQLFRCSTRYGIAFETCKSRRVTQQNDIHENRLVVRYLKIIIDNVGITWCFKESFYYTEEM